MSKELVISSNNHETRVAIIEEDQLAEIYFQRANEYSLAGSIHKGRVTRVLPGMQSAFVDLGLERDTFLYVSDFLEESGEDIERVTTDERAAAAGAGGGRRDRDRDRRGRGDRDRDRDRQAASPVAAPQVEPPSMEDVGEEEPAAAEPEAVSAAVVSEPATRGEESDRGGDRRGPGGRRSRRRRSRGRGFPESKYASDVAAEPEGQQQDSGVTELEDEEEAQPADVILLPGESLAKYSRRTPDPVERQQSHSSDLAPDTEPDERNVGAEETIEAAEDEEPITAFETAEVAGEAEPAGDLKAARTTAKTIAAVSEQDSEGAEDDAVTAEIEEQVDIAELEVAGITISEEIAAAENLEGEDDAAPAAEGDIDDIGVEESEEEDEETDAVESELAEDAAEPVAEETTLAAEGSASVRDQSDRFQHRQSRRMRRRGRGGDRGERGANERGAGERQERPAERTIAAAPAPAERSDRPPLPSISDLLREGQEIIVQIAKEPLGQKGARITSHIALPGRFVVYMPTLDHLGVSRKIASDEERQRLKRVLQASKAGLTGGFIVRTAGEGRTEEEIASDMAYLYNLWLDIRQKAEKRKAPALLHHDLDIVHRILRDQLSDMFKAIWVDNEEVYESVLRFMQRFQPALVGRVKMYTRPAPIFDAFSITTEIEKALRPKVWLKSGGYIVINQTEALVAIDVNTGKFVGKSNRLEDTITKINTDAVKEIVRQIRLRDLGGIIVVDFIDMDERKNRQKVMQALEEAMHADRAPYKILQFNDFGLVAITRKRVKQSLERTLCSMCPICEGAGYTKSVATVVGEILQEAQKIRKVVDSKNVELRVYPEVAKHLKSNQNSDLEEIEAIVGCPVLVTSDPALHPEKFDMAW